MQPSLPNGLELEEATKAMRVWAGRAGVAPGFPPEVLVMLYRDMARDDGWELRVQWDPSTETLTGRWHMNEREVGRRFHAHTLDDLRLIACAAHASRGDGRP